MSSSNSERTVDPSSSQSAESVAGALTREQLEHQRTMELWFVEGWAGNAELADRIFSDDFANNGVVVGPESPKRNIRNRLVGFPDLVSEVEQTFTVGDAVVLRLRWMGTHTGPYLGVAPTGRRVEVRGMTSWRFEDHKVVEDWTVGHIPLEIYGIEIPKPIPVQRPS